MSCYYDFLNELSNMVLPKMYYVVVKETIIEIEKQFHNPTPLEKALANTHSQLGTKEERKIKERIKDLDALK